MHTADERLAPVSTPTDRPASPSVVHRVATHADRGVDVVLGKRRGGRGETRMRVALSTRTTFSLLSVRGRGIEPTRSGTITRTRF